jgi:hypothetical protein
MLKKIIILLLILLIIVYFLIRAGLFLDNDNKLINFTNENTKNNRESEFLQSLEVMSVIVPEEMPKYLVYKDSYKRAVPPILSEDDGITVIFLTKDISDTVLKYYSDTLLENGYKVSKEKNTKINIQGTNDTSIKYSLEDKVVYIVVSEWDGYNAVGVTYYTEEIE